MDWTGDHSLSLVTISHVMFKSSKLFSKSKARSVSADFKAKRMCVKDDQLGVVMKAKKENKWYFCECSLSDLLITRFTPISIKGNVHNGRNVCSLNCNGAYWCFCTDCGVMTLRVNSNLPTFFVAGRTAHPITSGFFDGDVVVFGTKCGEVEMMALDAEKRQSREDSEVAYL